ncbi:MAG TPA: FISUMP domain-containing protein [Bacteroidota bacterium]|nr:FISUMP domain-containing protein [Bacteroidota bacterium]
MRSLDSILKPLRISGLFVALIFFLPFTTISLLFGATQNDSTTYSLHVNAGWNLLSLPLKVVGGTKESIFPTAVSNVFVFDTSYRVVDTLENGRGFWIKFASAETIAVTGMDNYSEAINLHVGWNLIGVLMIPAAVSTIQTNPAGIVTTNYFRFKPDSGYRSTDTLWPGSGYWVKVGQSGTMIIDPMELFCPANVDYVGKTYNTIQIGNRCWLKENLNIGSMILGVDSASDNGTIEKYCYDDDTANCTLYGGLYLWNEAMQYSATMGVQGICPPGWHIPTNAEFNTLSVAVNNDGNALKAIGQGSGEGAGTNLSGFSALLAGSRGGYDGYFADLSYLARLWGSQDLDVTSAYNIDLNYLFSQINLYSINKNNGFSVRCLKNYGAPPDIPSNPSPSENDTALFTSVVLSWSCNDPDGGILSFDVYFGTDNPPVTKVYSNLTTSSHLHSGLNENTTYYWRVIANAHGNLTEGPAWSFTTGGPYGLPCSGTPTVEYGGNTYNTVQIGSQCWLKEKLDIGTMIPGTDTDLNNGTIEKYCYDDDTANCSLYGGLYQWDEAMQYTTAPGSQGICPPGWHIPTYEEFDTLRTTVGGDGNALKAVGQGTGGGAGTNTSGFSTVLSGFRGTTGYFSNLSNGAYFWSSTEYDEPSARHMDLHYYFTDITLNYYGKSFGFSVRCIED